MTKVRIVTTYTNSYFGYAVQERGWLGWYFSGNHVFRSLPEAIEYAQRCASQPSGEVVWTDD